MQYIKQIHFDAYAYFKLVKANCFLFWQNDLIWLNGRSQIQTWKPCTMQIRFCRFIASLPRACSIADSKLYGLNLKTSRYCEGFVRENRILCEDSVRGVFDHTENKTDYFSNIISINSKQKSTLIARQSSTLMILLHYISLCI